MKKKIARLLGLLLTVTVFSQSSANADFEGDFAPSNWTYSETSSVSHSLTSTQMQITSKDSGPLVSNSASYSIYVPYYIDSISFDYSYVTTDINGSPFDMPQYKIDDSATNLVSSDIPQNGSESGTRSIGDIGGKSFAIIQNAIDSQLGAATVTITNFTTRYRNMSSLRLIATPQVSEKDGLVTCTPGAYSLLNGGASSENVTLSSVTYTLVIDGIDVGRLSAGSSSLPAHMFSPLTSMYAGSASLSSAVFELKGKQNLTASCKVSVTQGPLIFSASSATIKDSAKLAAEAKIASDYELARMTATAANFTKDAREARKRAAARSGN
jgi:hypothetical protein